MNKKGKIAVFTLLAFFAVTLGGLNLAAPATAQASGSITVIENTPEAALANIIFRILDIPVTVYEISSIRTTHSLSHGEIALAYSLAHQTGQSVNHILHLRFDRHMGWGKIAKMYGVKLRGASDKSMYMLREARLDRDADDFRTIIQIDLDDDDNDHDRNDNHKPGKGHGRNK